MRRWLGTAFFVKSGRWLRRGLGGVSIPDPRGDVGGGWWVRWT